MSRFNAVKEEFKSSPNVVIYNAGSLTNPPEEDSVLSIPADGVTGDLIVNTVTPYAAAQMAVKGWETLPKEMRKTFIFTGNITNVAIIPMPLMINGGMGKAASAYWIGASDAFFKSKGYR